MKKYDKNLQQEIIDKQLNLISQLEEENKALKVELEMKDNFSTENTVSKQFMEDISLFRVELSQTLDEAKKAKKAYEDALADVRPLIKEYNKKMKELNDAIEVARLNIK